MSSDQNVRPRGFAAAVGFPVTRCRPAVVVLGAAGLTGVDLLTEVGFLALPLVSAGFFLIAPGFGAVEVFAGVDFADADLSGVDFGGGAEIAFFAGAGFGPGAGRAFLGVPASIFF